MNVKSKLFIIGSILSIALFLSCSGDDNANTVRNDSEIRGSWELIQIRNTSIPREVDAPSDEEPIVIFFFENDFSGRTPNNDFIGNYIADGEELILVDFGSTSEDDTTWANQFFLALSQGLDVDSNQFNFNYEVTETNLSIECDVDFFLIFKRI